MAEHVSEDQMSPEASPGEVSKRSGVRRVNNLPVYLVGGVMTVFLLVMVLVAADRAAQQNQPDPGAKESGGNSSLFANEIAGKQKDGIIPAAAAKPLQVPELAAPVSAIPIARPDNLDAPPMPPRSAGDGTLQRTPRDDELDRIRMVKMQQLEEAVKAKTTVQVVAARSAGSPPGGVTGAPGSREEAIARLAAVRQQIDAVGRDDPTAAYKARLAQLQGAGGGVDGTPVGATSDAAVVDDLVALVEHDDFRLVRGHLLRRHLGETHDRHAVAGFAEVRGGAVELDGPAARRRLDGVGLEALGVAHVRDQDALVGRHAAGVHQFDVYGQTAFVVHGGVGHRGAVDFGEQKGAKHWGKAKMNRPREKTTLDLARPICHPPA